ncbi:hypothetical protein EU557_22280 [Hymenobacter wooponensis]|uniref:Uncharacterized protein n=1 Tax=Hymenobacter wooponensis TaxID=1525360 RepID=A0A4Z0MER4_9BACT|nr:hypothetical protein EU557_22280 [Hymenobacter wooponensis]
MLSRYAQVAFLTLKLLGGIVVPPYAYGPPMPVTPAVSYFTFGCIKVLLPVSVPLTLSVAVITGVA